MRQAITATDQCEYHHMPDTSDQPDTLGLTVRGMLSAWRDVDWGNIGGTYDVQLSDGTMIGVELQTDGGGRLMSSQQAVRSEVDRGCERIVRRYQL